MDNVTIRKKFENDDIPWDLLLMADPSKEAISKYLNNSDIYFAILDGELVGISVITEENNVVELKNLAVYKKHRGKGIGKQLIRHAIEQARNKKASRIDVGTGNSSTVQLALYQQCGFTMRSIEKGFFVKNYTEPIFENGVQCIDMIRLSIDLE